MPETTPTERELEILKILWQREEATVREVYDQISREVPIVQNTVQAFLRTMEEKGLVRHRLCGRTFVYAPVLKREQTSRQIVATVLQRVFDGAVDQLVDSALSVRQPTPEELARLETLVKQAKASAKRTAAKERKGKDT